MHEIQTDDSLWCDSDISKWYGIALIQLTMNYSI